MPAHKLDITALPGYAEIIETAWATGTDPLELLRLRPEFRSGAMNRAVRQLRKVIMAERAAYEREERARRAECRRNRIDALGRMVRCGGGYLTERERDAIRAHLDVKGRLTPAHMERAGYGLVDGEWIGSLDVWATGHKAY